jgi:hypothetical protein
MGIVCKHYARRKENIVFHDGVLTNVHIAMNPHPIAQHAVVIHCRVIPDCAVMTNTVPFANDDVVARLKSVSDFYRGVNHAPGADSSFIPNAYGPAFDGASRRIAKYHAGINRAILS